MGDVKDPDEFFDVAEKILEKINAVFERDNSLDEFDVVPVESQSNRSPVIHVDHKLALESWCVPFLYSHSFKCFMELLPKRNYSQKHKLDAGNFSKSLASTGHKSRNYQERQLTEEDRIERKLQLSRLLIMLNPDLSLAWNFRRDAVIQGWTRFPAEIHLVSLVVSRKPKSFESFSYRKWLLKHLMSTQNLTIESWWQLFTKEIQVLESAAAAYFSNYHAWDYRRWLLETLLSNVFQTSEVKEEVLRYEKALSDEWMEKHVSDHSGIHYRQHLLSRIGQECSDVMDSIKVFKKELENNLSFISRYPGHETLWYHRRFLLQYIISGLHGRAAKNHNHRMEVDCDLESSQWEGWENELKHMKEKEQDLVQSALTQNGSICRSHGVNVNFITKETVHLNFLYAQKHSKWLFMMFEWNLLDNNK